MATILIVDDNKNNLQVLGNILNESKYRVAMAMNGSNAIKLAKKTNPDLIILDIMMPEMDGFEVCTKLKTDPKTSEIPIIFLTAKTDLEDVIKGFQLGGVDYITKPFKKEELLVRVRNHINLVESKKLIEHQAEELKAANSLKDKIFAVVASDLKNAMESFVKVPDLLLDNRINFTIEEYKDVFVDLKVKASNTIEFLENIIWWSRSQRNLLHPKLAKINTLTTVNEVIRKFEEKIKAKQLTVEVDIAHNLEFVGDPAFVQLIVKNIIQNAIHFSPAAKRIKVSGIQNKNEVQVTISDQGVGMNTVALAEVLNPFSYHTDFGTDNEKGNGLGIKLTQELLKIMNGNLKIESQENSGTTVTIQFKTEI